MEHAEVWLGMLIGLVIGSYLSCVTWRLPRRLPLGGGSRCAVCARPLQARDNVPVLAWLLLRGRSRCCRTPISWRYPAYELLAGTIGGLLGLLGIAYALVAAGLCVIGTVGVALALGIPLGADPRPPEDDAPTGTP